MTLVGFARLQLGWVAGAAEVLDVTVEAVGSDAGSVAVASHLAFVRLAEGRITDASRLAAAVLADARTSYFDRTMAHTAAGLVAARLGDVVSVRSSFRAARAEVDVTGDVLTQAYVRLAEGRALDQVGDSAAVDRTAEAWSRLHEIGIEGTGWRNVFDLGLGLKAPVAAD